MRKHKSNSKQTKTGKEKTLRVAFEDVSSRPGPSFWEPDETNLQGTAERLHGTCGQGPPWDTLKSTFQERSSLRRVFRTGRPGFWSVSSPIPRRMNWEDIPHKPFCKLLDKIINLNPVIRNTPGPEKKKTNGSAKHRAKLLMFPQLPKAGVLAPLQSEVQVHVRSWNFTIWTESKKPRPPHFSGGQLACELLRVRPGFSK